MPMLSRADTSVLGRWWWTVDRWTLAAIGALVGFGYVMVLAASPAVAERIHEARDMLVAKQVVFLLLAGLVVVAVSLLSLVVVWLLLLGISLIDRRRGRSTPGES